MGRHLSVATESEGSFLGVVVAGGEGVAFGGHLVAHSITSAAHAVSTGRHPDSVHTRFLRPASPDLDVRYDVEITKSGRSFDNLRVDAWQSGLLVAATTISFTTFEEGFDYQEAMPEVAGPDDIEPSTFVPPGTEASVRAHFDIRYAEKSSGTSTSGPTQIMWLRAREPLGDDPSAHAAAVAWFSDLSLPWTAELPYEGAALARAGASLDHVMWFHRPFRADGWLLFTQRNPVYAHSRALTYGHFYSADGLLVATAAQETLLRRTPIGP